MNLDQLLVLGPLTLAGQPPGPPPFSSMNSASRQKRRAAISQRTSMFQPTLTSPCYQIFCYASARRRDFDRKEVVRLVESTLPASYFATSQLGLMTVRNTWHAAT